MTVLSIATYLNQPGGETFYYFPAQVQQHYDLVLLSCKAYDLQTSMDAIAPEVGPDTTILPALNGNWGN